MNLVDKQFMMFKFFLSMNGIFLNNDKEENVRKAFIMSHNENINYNIMSDAYFLEVLNRSINDSETIQYLYALQHQPHHVA
jgi:hypothetical protein